MKKNTAVTCACGSNRKYARCCAPAGSEQLQFLLQEAIIWQEQGDAERALIRYQDVLKNDKRNAAASYLCGTVYQQKGDFQRALLSFKRAFKLGLKDPAAKIQYAHTLLSTGQSDQAVKVLKQLLAGHPDVHQARYLLANLYFESEAFSQAEAHYRQLLTQADVDWSLHFNLGHTLYHLSQIPLAIEQFTKALTLNSTNADIFASLATVYQLDNQLDEASRCAQKALEMQPGNVSATIVIARLLRGEKQWLQALAVLDDIDPAVLESGDQVLWWQERGRLLDILQRYKEAFEAFSCSRQVLCDLRGIAFDASFVTQHLAASEACFANIKPAASKTADEYRQDMPPQPLFIVGFYRSGTTLLEQMLSSHPNICGVGETGALAATEDRLKQLLGKPYPQCFKKGITKKQEEVLQILRKEYNQNIAKLDGYQQNTRLVVDKFLFNMLRLPLINMMFPESYVIHMVRHPLDVLVSTYSTLFLDRNEWSYTMQDIAQMYVRCHRHVQSMRGQLGDRYFYLRYEDLVDNPKKELQTLLEFTGEDWHPNCLEFYRNPRIARTASYEQVQRKLYTEAKFRYKNYLESIDEQVIQILDPVITELGYRVET